MSVLEYNQTLIANADFNRLSSFIYKEIGIKLPPAKKSMLEGRLQKHLKVLGLHSFKEYCDYVLGPTGQQERTKMMDLVTTNKTDFFREPAHFTFLQSDLLPELTGRSAIRPLKCWSAGCSSGEEPYTLAMVFSEYAEQEPMLNFQIYATDISTAVLEMAAKAVYPHGRITDIPQLQRQKYLLRSKDPSDFTVRIAPAIRKKVHFARLNFMQDQYDVPSDFDIIFCRNVLIYFDKPTQERVIGKLCNHLRKDGYLFLGHSESITDMRLPLKQIRPTIFKKTW